MRSDKRCKAMTGLKCAAFERLWMLVKPNMIATSTRGSPLKRRRADHVDGSDESSLGSKVLLSDRQVFFLTLHWLRVYEPENVLESIFDIDARNLHRHIWRGLTALHKSLVPHYLPGLPKFEDNQNFWLRSISKRTLAKSVGGSG
jgi:hypothetical protein